VVQRTQPAGTVSKTPTSSVLKTTQLDTMKLIARWLRVAVLKEKLQWNGIGVPELMVFW